METEEIDRYTICPYVPRECSMFTSYQRSPIYPTIPFRCIIFGPSGSGKTTFISSMLSGQCEALYCQYDLYTGMGLECGDYNTPGYPTMNSPYQITKPPKGCNGQLQHCINIIDDPNLSDKYLRDYLTNVYKKSRHYGQSQILCLHSLEDLNKSGLSTVINNCNMIVMTRQATESYGGNARRLVNLMGSSQASSQMLSLANSDNENDRYCVLNKANNQVSFISSEY